MTWAIAGLLASTFQITAQDSARAATARVSARIVRAGEASRRTLEWHPKARIRTITERTDNGRSQTVIIFDFE
jgi:hypothetical protein